MNFYPDRELLCPDRESIGNTDKMEWTGLCRRSACIKGVLKVWQQACPAFNTTAQMNKRANNFTELILSAHLRIPGPQ